MPLSNRVWRDTYLEGWKARSSRPVAQSWRLLLFWCLRVLPAYQSYTKWVNFSILGPILLWIYPYCRLFWYHSSTDSIQGEKNGKMNLPAPANTSTEQVLVKYTVDIYGKLLFQTLAWLLHCHTHFLVVRFCNTNTYNLFSNRALQNTVKNEGPP